MRAAPWEGYVGDGDPVKTAGRETRAPAILQAESWQSSRMQRVANP